MLWWWPSNICIHLCQRREQLFLKIALEFGLNIFCENSASLLSIILSIDEFRLLQKSENTTPEVCKAGLLRSAERISLRNYYVHHANYLKFIFLSAASKIKSFSRISKPLNFTWSKYLFSVQYLLVIFAFSMFYTLL